MTTNIKWLDQLSGLTEEDLQKYGSFKRQVGKKEVVLGTLEHGGTLHRAWTLSSKLFDEKLNPLQQEIEGLVAEHEKLHEDPDHSPEDCSRFHEDLAPKVKELKELGAQFERLRKIFWLMTEVEFQNGFQGDPDPGLGIREGLVVVQIPPKIEGFLGSILGSLSDLFAQG